MPDEMNPPGSENLSPPEPAEAAGAQQQRSTSMREEVSAARGVPYPVVGIGASAGGLEAISNLLRELPANTGMAFVIVQHLDPNYASELTDLLARTTEMPVMTIEEGMTIAPNNVYIIPPNTDLTLENGKLHLSARKPGLHMPIDSFFTSLARAQGSRAIGIVLSGNASDGSQGVRMIKGDFGLTFAQDEASARHGGMPRNAVATGTIDFVMPPAEIARELVRISAHPYVVPPSPRQPDQEILPEGESELKRIFEVLHSATKVDFTQYKRNTIRRRIGRRMVVQRTQTLAEYSRYLDAHPQEARELYRDLLINVTNFFRDPQAFTVLTKLVADTIVNRKSDDAFRVWVPGCASGEEVYSLAICLSELLQVMNRGIPLQLFGTDINEAALEKGRSGVYPEDISEEVSQERLQRFFNKVDSGYQINRAIRDCCVFARQDLTRDPPFAHTDLVTCRNVLIYMDAALQRRILPVLHYSLNPSGLLMLGSAETVGAAPELFDAVDKQHRIYSRRAVPVRLTLDLSLGRSTAETQTQAQPAALSGADLVKKVDRVIQSKYSPAAVVVDGDLQILQFRGHTSFYFDPTPGDASLNLLRMVRESMVVALRRCIEAAANQGVSTSEAGVQVDHRGEQRNVTIEVTPIPGVAPGERYFLVVFDEVPEPAKTDTTELAAALPADPTEYLVEVENHRRQLQHQLAETREYLRNLNEDHEVSMEELRAANEEVRSANEELQSTNEELSTTKEELQSANEELTTVNEELQNRNHELDAVNNDLSNLLSAVSIPILMVDGGLRVRRFNSTAEKLMELTAVDVGRPVAHLRGNLEVPNLDRIVRAVLETLVTRSEEVQDKQGHWYSLIVRPYRTADNRIDGAVIVFVDIDPLKRSLTLAEEARDYAEGMIETVREPLIVLDADLRVQRATSTFYEMFRVSREETIGRFLYDLGNGQWNRPKLREMLGNALFRNLGFHDFEVEHEFPHLGRKTMRLNAQRIPRRDGDRDRAVLLSIEDISVRRAEAEIKYQRLFEAAKDGILVLDFESRAVTDVNPFLLELTGFGREDLIGKRIEDMTFFRDAGVVGLIGGTSEGVAIRLERTAMATRSGQTVEVEVVANRYQVGAQAAIQLNIRDVTERRREELARASAEAALKVANERLRRANSDLEQFAHAASHDLQEPLRTIALYTDLFRKNYGDRVEPEAQQFIGVIHDSAARLHTLVDTLLSYARNTAPFEPPTALIDAGAVLDSVRANLHTSIEENQATVTGGRLPAVRMHESHLVQIFQNLIGNAIKYRSAKPPRILVTGTERDNDWVFSVMDNGIGVEPENMRAIFGLFSRPRGKERPGSGLGLAICAKIIENYHGRIWVESVPGEGSHFFFSIPKAW
jgi:two-component system CheB/CheR fusion protein